MCKAVIATKVGFLAKQKMKERNSILSRNLYFQPWQCLNYILYSFYSPFNKLISKFV